MKIAIANIKHDLSKRLHLNKESRYQRYLRKLPKGFIDWCSANPTYNVEINASNIRVQHPALSDDELLAEMQRQILTSFQNEQSINFLWNHGVIQASTFELIYDAKCSTLSPNIGIQITKAYAVVPG